MSTLIRSDNDAWDVLRSLISNEIEEDFANVDLDGWPLFEVKSHRGRAEIDTSTMKSFLAIQEGLNRAFLQYTDNSRDLRLLTEDYRKQLEFSVRVTEGSSIFNVDFGDQFKNFVDALGKKMTGQQITILLITGGLLFTSHSIWSNHISENARIRMAKIDAENQRGILADIAEMSDKETERMNVMAQIIKSYPDAQGIYNESERARQDFLRSLPRDSDITIEGMSLSPDVLEEITKPERRQSSEAKITRTFIVDRAQTTNEGFTIRLKSTEDEQAIIATFGDILGNLEERQLVQSAFWSKRPIELTLNAKTRDGVIVSAVIEHARYPDDRGVSHEAE